MLRLIVLSALLVIPLSGLAQGRAQLDTFVAELNSLSGQFEQHTLDADGFLLERSVGEFAVQSPNRFRWDYQDPFPQMILADGQSVWVYDVELEQVSVRPQSEDGSDSPLALLANPALLDQQYEVSESVDGEGVAWLSLTPLATESQFQSVDLGFENDRLQRMLMRDSFGQVTDIRFDLLLVNPELPGDRFHFEPPPGVDVLGELPGVARPGEPVIRSLEEPPVMPSKDAAGDA